MTPAKPSGRGCDVPGYNSKGARLLREVVARMNARRAREGLPPALTVTEQKSPTPEKP